ncbi:MAG: DUF423 domain-containing protein [Acidobacteriota bacterium]
MQIRSPRVAAVGALLAAVAVAAGAFGAHGLADRLDARGLELWETAARYLIYSSFGAMLAGLVGARPAGVALISGGLIFAGAVGGLALGAPRFLGAVAPIGGLGMIGGFAALAWVLWSAQSSGDSSAA